MWNYAASHVLYTQFQRPLAAPVLPLALSQPVQSQWKWKQAQLLRSLHQCAERPWCHVCVHFIPLHAYSIRFNFRELNLDCEFSRFSHFCFCGSQILAFAPSAPEEGTTFSNLRHPTVCPRVADQHTDTKKWCFCTRMPYNHFLTSAWILACVASLKDHRLYRN